MPILAADDLELQYAGRRIFDGDSLSIEPMDRIGIVGPNGAGKSSLLKILAGHLTPDSGRVLRASGCRVGYLPQEHGDVGAGTLIETVLEAAPRRSALEERTESIQAALETADEDETRLTLAEELAQLVSELADLDQEYGPHRAEQILVGLGFRETDLDRPLKQFSGGWRMRAALATLLFERPDVLLLDEPTNHLDMPSVKWLDTFLRTYRKSVVMTCHDREFLNSQIRRVASLELDGLRVYAGNYTQYLEQRALELEYLEARARKDEQRKKELEAFVTRFRAKASKARQAQSKAKLIEKLEEQQVELPQVRKLVSIKFRPSDRSGDPVARIEKLSFGYGPNLLFSNLDLTIRRRDRIAIVGVNGAGKTTLLRLLAGELKPTEGKISFGSNVQLSYFAQHHTEALKLHNSVLEEVWAVDHGLPEASVRGLCGAFLFSGDDVEKRVGVLSGGEKARVALARLLAVPGNFLLLDEPTNHLDTESADRLTESLEGYDGTLVFVSHNLDFARRLSTTVWDVRVGLVETYAGSLAEYLAHLETQAAALEKRVTAAEKPQTTADKTTRIEAREAQKKREAELRRNRTALERRILNLEQEISQLEAEGREIERQLADPSTHGDAMKMRAIVPRYEEVKSTLQERMNAWENAQAELEAFGARPE